MEVLMISPELLRRYPFFSCFTHEQLDELAMAGDEFSVAADHCFFEEGDSLTRLFLLQEGTVALTVNVPDRNGRNSIVNHLTGDLITQKVKVGTLGKQDIFGWSALVPPHESTAGAQAVEPCQVIAIDIGQLRPQLKKDPQFNHLLTLKVAQIIRERLQMRRIESLGGYVDYA